MTKSIVSPMIIFEIPEGSEEAFFTIRIMEQLLEIDGVRLIRCPINEKIVTFSKDTSFPRMVPGAGEIINRLPKIEHKSTKPGDIIKVKVGGVEYDTVINDNHTQRFIENPDHFLLKRIRDYSGGGNPEGDVKDLNEMAIRYHHGEFSKRDYAEMNMAIGYSVSGFSELSYFEDWDIDNPIWSD